MTPETLGGIGEALGIIFIAAATAAGGYFAKGTFRRQTNTKQLPASTEPYCGKHEDIVEKITRIPEMYDSLLKLNAKFDHFVENKWEDMMSELWGVIRSHERMLGELHGTVSTIEQRSRHED